MSQHEDYESIMRDTEVDILLFSGLMTGTVARCLWQGLLFGTSPM